MPAADVIDLLSSDDEYDEGPRKATLASFAPRKDKAISQGKHGSKIGVTIDPTDSNGKQIDDWASTAAGGDTCIGATATDEGENVLDADLTVYHSHGVHAGNEEPSLRDLLAGVASHDLKRLEKYRSSLGSKHSQNPAGGPFRNSGVNKSHRSQGIVAARSPERRSPDVASQQKGSPRMSDGYSIRPFKRHAPRPAPIPIRTFLKQAASNVPKDLPSNNERKEELDQATARSGYTNGTQSTTPLVSGAGLAITKAPLSSGREAIHMAPKRALDTTASRVSSTFNKKRQKLDSALSSRKLVSEPAVIRAYHASDDTDETNVRISYSDEPKPPYSLKAAETAMTADDRTTLSSSNAVLRPMHEPVGNRTIALRETLPTIVSQQMALWDPAPVKATAQDIRPAQQRTTSRNQPWTDDDDRLLQQLKEVHGLTWDKIMEYFPGRTRGATQVHYSTSVRGKQIVGTPEKLGRSKRGPGEAAGLASTKPKSKGNSPPPNAAVRSRRARGVGPAAADGMVSWASLRSNKDHTADVDMESTGDKGVNDDAEDITRLTQDCVNPSSLPRILRLRETGLTGFRAWEYHPRAAPEELQNHVFRDYGLQQQYHGTSGDVVALSWAPNDNRFVAGSIAISDSTSMQYNMSRNLIVGDADSGELQELADHHVPRPVVEDLRNVNGLHAMRQTQDPRLFLTVTAAGFSPKGDKLYTAGTDKMLRLYVTNRTLDRVTCRHAISHTASVDLMAVHASGAVATGCHSPTASINLYKCSKKSHTHLLTLGPSRSNLTVSVAIFPSAIKWGIAPRQQNFILAGFSGDEEKANAGETCLWDVATGQEIELRGSATRNVFDVAWNPNPSSASHAFAVASLSTGHSVSKGTRSIVSLFAPQDRDATRKRSLECQAGDLNDVVFCPHDDQLVAAGSTDGTVYVWDLRSKSSDPLHMLQHGESENVLAHDRDRELTDTGVRFLSWGATGSRLYSGASDGIVKVWNPYRSASNAFVEDIAPPRNQRSAVMSGSFSSDNRQLLVGTENGRIDLFSIGARSSTRPKRFKLSPVSPPVRHEDGGPFAGAQELVQSGKIDIRPCGAMPFKQAVKGQNYDGPFLAPTTDEHLQAKVAYESALIAQHEISMKQPVEYTSDIEDEVASKANRAVQETQQRIDDLQERLDHFTFAEPKAIAFQEFLRAAEHEREMLDSQCAQAEPCELDCSVLPTTDGIDDSGRSKLRIPSALRSLYIDAAHERCVEEPDESCAMCFPTNALARNGVRRYCPACQAKRAGLTSRCKRCAQPARTQTDQETNIHCERCSFSCFRCGEQASCASSDSGVLDSIECTSCDLVWQAGSLGYELKHPPILRHARRRSDELSDKNLKASCCDELAQEEREHYASLWETRAGNECM